MFIAVLGERVIIGNVPRARRTNEACKLLNRGYEAASKFERTNGSFQREDIDFLILVCNSGWEILGKVLTFKGIQHP